MIQDIGEHQFINGYKKEKPDSQSFILYYRDRDVLVRKAEGQISFPRFKDLEHYGKYIYEKAIFLFTIDDDNFYLVESLCLKGEVPSFSWESINIFRTASPQYAGFAEILGYQLHGWYESHRFCGKCGRPMSHSEKERMMFCGNCNLMEYPRISPAVIVGVINENKILMSKYAGREYTNYALLAGFIEVGETVEEAIEREVLEEVGLKVKNFTYYKSQPWPVSGSLLLGYFVQLEGDDKITLDEEELSMADWFGVDEITMKRDNISLTNEMIMIFKDGKVKW
jgi:NTP pyrophosphohydrolases containing a Zn-finger, probably nucleic-acid-binding